jgi:pimeloyl-ACP methyl ester carboxylesterase
MKSTVARRYTFYLSGFDPRGGRHYHQLYKQQAALQSSSLGVEWSVSRRQRVSEIVDEWQVIAVEPAMARQTHTTMGFLRWDDIVRRHWASSLSQVLRDLWLFIQGYLLTGLVMRFTRTSPKQLIAGLYPMAFLLLTFCIAGLAAFCMHWGLAHFLGGKGAAFALELVAGLGTAWFVLHCAMKLANRLAVFWLLRIYVFNMRWARGLVPELEHRLEACAVQIVTALKDPDADEVVVVGHSVGSMLAVSALARALARLKAEQVDLPLHRVVLVTLGECIPLVSFQPEAEKFRQEMHSLAQDDRLLWLDYTAPSDGACFPLLDPVAASGLSSRPGAGPRILSPRFFTLFTAERYAQLRRDWYTMHFLYLMASELSGDYDYFKLTAGVTAVSAGIEGAPL